MNVYARCPHCGITINLGNTGFLPQPSRFMEQLASVHHDHVCKRVDARPLAV